MKPQVRARTKIAVDFEVAAEHLSEYLISTLDGEPDLEARTETKEIESGAVLIYLTKNGRDSIYELNPAGPGHCYVSAVKEQQFFGPTREIEEEINKLTFEGWAAGFANFCVTGKAQTREEVMAATKAALSRLSPEAREAVLQTGRTETVTRGDLTG